MANAPDESRIVLDEHAPHAPEAPEPDDRPRRQRSREHHVDCEPEGVHGVPAPRTGPIEPSEGDVIVPWERLSDDALLGVLSEFVTREGTEYGEHDVSLERKIADVRRQLERGEIVLLFDAKSETVNLVRKSDLAGRPQARSVERPA